jgi:phosphatidylglycerophosphatase A
MLLATGFGAGRIPRVPGTAGSLVGLALFAAAERGARWAAARDIAWREPATLTLWYAAIAFALALAGVWAAAGAARRLGTHDPQVVVIDEISGQWLACAPLLAGAGGAMTSGWAGLLVAFLLFRIFDIWKPPPVRRAERLPGGWGVMADDWLAGMYAAILLWVLQLVGM